MSELRHDLRDLTTTEVLTILDSLMLVIEVSPASLGISGASAEDVRRLIRRIDFQMNRQRRNEVK